MSNNKFYTGIGSRKTPKNILDLMSQIASKLEELGWTLRSGGAGGADLAFESGVKTNKEVYLPWKGFNKSQSKLFHISEEALQIASENHPNWTWLKENQPSVCKLMARNVYQVQGYDLDKNSNFVICWTEDGCESDEDRTSKTGGTGLAISVASKLGIPVFNLANEKSKERVMKLLEKE